MLTFINRNDILSFCRLNGWRSIAQKHKSPKILEFYTVSPKKCAACGPKQAETFDSPEAELSFLKGANNDLITPECRNGFVGSQ